MHQTSPYFCCYVRFVFSNRTSEIYLKKIKNLTLRARTVLKCLKKYRQFCCTMHLNGKNLACFTGNLVQNLMNFFLSSKSDRKGPKMAKTKIVQKKAYIWLLEANR